MLTELEMRELVGFFVNSLQKIFDMMQTTVLFVWEGQQITLFHLCMMFLVLGFLLGVVKMIRGY